MDETFDIPVTYKGQELSFSARLLQLGCIHKFAVDVNGQEIYYEPDEERNYRALVDPELFERDKKMDIQLLKAIAAAIENILK